MYIFGFGLSSSELSRVLVLASIARRINATSRAPLLYLVSRRKNLAHGQFANFSSQKSICKTKVEVSGWLTPALFLFCYNNLLRIDFCELKFAYFVAPKKFVYLYI